MSYITGPPLHSKTTFEVLFWSEEHKKWMFDSPHDSPGAAFKHADELEELGLKTQVQKDTHSKALVVREGE